MTPHALLAPSAAHRWINCPAAPRLEDTVPESSTAFSEEGTLAHAYCSRRLKSALGLSCLQEDYEIRTLSPKYHSGEMDEYTAAYADTVLGKYAEACKKTSDAVILIESRLDLSAFVPEAFGTVDAAIIADGCMEIIDFKYGKGVEVSAVGNEQMRIYALGAQARFSFDYDIRRVRMTVYQPRLSNISSEEMELPDLLAWADAVLRPAAKEAYSGNGKQNPGEWCRFCKVRATCAALAEQALEAVAVDDPQLLTPRQLAENVLPRLAQIKAWASAVEEYALKRALDGTEFPGFKVVACRSVRRITNADAVADLLRKEGFTENDFMKPPELRGIPELEKITGKKRFNALCGGYIIKPVGKPTLAPLSDKRKEYNSAASDFADIKL